MQGELAGSVIGGHCLRSRGLCERFRDLHRSFRPNSEEVNRTTFHHAKAAFVLQLSLFASALATVVVGSLPQMVMQLHHESNEASKSLWVDEHCAHCAVHQ